MMFTLETDYLRDCPFCASEAKIKLVDHPVKIGCILVRVECSRCHARTADVMTGKDYFTEGKYITLTEAVGKVVNNWNERQLDNVAARTKGGAV